jgi:hypothetical protein
MTIRSNWGPLLDDEFDVLDSGPDGFELVSATSLDKDGTSHDVMGRRRKKTIRLEDPDSFLPEEPPPGWAEP